jgi:hypothetical protein
MRVHQYDLDATFLQEMKQGEPVVTGGFHAKDTVRHPMFAHESCGPDQKVKQSIFVILNKCIVSLTLLRIVERTGHMGKLDNICSKD